MTFSLRAPGPDDAPALADLHVATWRETYTHLLPEGFFSAEHIDGRHRMWRAVLAQSRDDVSIRLAESGGELVGFAWVGPSVAPTGEDPPPRERTLYAIYVSARHHGSGIGQALLDAVLHGGPAMLWVAKENPRAIAFYERSGFRLDGVEKSDPMAPLITDARMLR